MNRKAKGSRNERKTLICGVCSKIFYSGRGNRTYSIKPNAKYCSLECSSESKKRQVKLTCVICRSSFQMSYKHSLLRNTCSMECRSKYNKVHQLGSGNNNYKGGPKPRVCKKCGYVFRSYDSKRLYCSVECSPRDYKMRARLNYERELFKLLEKFGYSCIRSAGSRGPVDVFAMNKKHFRFIQIKSTKDFNRHGNLSMFSDALEELRKIQIPPETSVELWVRVLREGWRYIKIPIIPNTREEIKTLIRNAEWVFVDFTDGSGL